MVRREHLPPAYHVVWGGSLLLLAVGLVMVFSVSSVAALFQGEDSLYYFRQQGAVAVLGVALLVGLSRFDYQRWRPLAVFGLVLTLGLLAAVHLPGIGLEVNGARSWIGLGPIALQPSEAAKLTTVVVAACLLSAPRSLGERSGRLLMPLGLVAGGICLLVLAEGDMGTAVIIAGITMGLLWVAGLRLWLWSTLVLLAGAAAALLTIITPYRLARFRAFLDPFAYPRDDGYQLVQSLIALGSGGVHGIGPGRSVQKFSSLPEARTDMILAILGEEFGLLGVAAVLLLFAVLVVAAWRIAQRCRDPFGKYLAAGCTLLIGGQAVLNAGGVLGALPLTGVPLPFISYGKLNLLVMLAAVGMILSVARFGPTEPGDAVHTPYQEPTNVAYLDRRGRHGGTRGARPRSR
jgi:cell division protein FtsW